MLVTRAAQAMSYEFSRSGITFPFTKWNISLVFLSLLFSIPLFVVLGSVLIPEKDIWVHLYNTVLFDYVSNSLFLVLGVGSISLLLGVIPAWLVTMYRFPLSKQLEWALLLPLAMPAYIIRRHA